MMAHSSGNFVINFKLLIYPRVYCTVSTNLYKKVEIENSSGTLETVANAPIPPFSRPLIAHSVSTFNSNLVLSSTLV